MEPLRPEEEVFSQTDLQVKERAFTSWCKSHVPKNSGLEAASYHLQSWLSDSVPVQYYDHLSIMAEDEEEQQTLNPVPNSQKVLVLQKECSRVLSIG